MNKYYYCCCCCCWCSCCCDFLFVLNITEMYFFVFLFSILINWKKYKTHNTNRALGTNLPTPPYAYHSSTYLTTQHVCYTPTTSTIFITITTTRPPPLYLTTTFTTPPLPHHHFTTSPPLPHPTAPPPHSITHHYLTTTNTPPPPLTTKTNTHHLFDIVSIIPHTPNNQPPVPTYFL